MQVEGLDGKEYKLDLRNKRELGEYDKPRSQYHINAKSLILKLFPVDVILEEIYLPGCKTKLYVDFFLPLRRIMVEVNGCQHSEYSGFMHGDPLSYIRGKGRDVEKIKFCELNDLCLVVLDYREDEETWKIKLIQAHQT